MRNRECSVNGIAVNMTRLPFFFRRKKIQIISDVKINCTIKATRFNGNRKDIEVNIGLIRIANIKNKKTINCKSGNSNRLSS